MKEFNEYYQKAKRTLRGGPKRRYVFGLACEMLAKDWLKERGWKIRGSITTPRRFTKRQLIFLKREGSAFDFYAFKKKKEKFAIVEIKSTKRRTSTFDFASKDQREYYEKALKLGIPIKFIFVKILDDKVNEIRMCDYPKDLMIFKKKVRPKRASEPKKKPIKKGITKMDVEEMKTMYAQGFTQKEIAKKFGIKSSTVRYHLKKSDPMEL